MAHSRDAPSSLRHSGLLLCVGLCFSLGLPACALNPATGKRQLSLIGQREEISMGRDADRELVSSMGLYEDAALTGTVRRVGQTLAAHSERPGLPWTFRVVDDAAVNAFALPGGYIYITRGILAHLASEAELAGVLGHEIGHVTSRHSVNQMSKSRLAGLGLNLGRILRPGLGKYDDLTGMGMGLLFLKYSRDDERQADDLGLRYMVRAGYSPASMEGVFQMLEQVSSAGGGSTPAWLATHPSPADRQSRIKAEVAALQTSPHQGRTGSAEYLNLLDGLVYGINPRHGFFRGDTFYQPDMKFSFRFPAGWKHANQTAGVVGAGPSGGAQLQLSLSKEPTPATAAAHFFAPDPIKRGTAWQTQINGLPTVSYGFHSGSGGAARSGVVAFVSLDGQVFQLLGLAGTAGWSAAEKTIRAALASFRRLEDPDILAVAPRRLKLVRLDREMNLQEFDRRYPSSVKMEELAILNRVKPAQRLPAGHLVKRVVGGA